jgi:sugar lactone lactonase YvrE
MRLGPRFFTRLILSLLLLACFAKLSNFNPSSAQSTDFKIVGPNKETTPVVNESGQLQLSLINPSGQTISGATFSSGSPDIAGVDPQTGMVFGMQRGFATITARNDNVTVSAFVVVTRVGKSNGAKVTGDTKTDTRGRIYISDPTGNVILRKDGFAAPAQVFAGRKGVQGKLDGKREEALFSGPLAVGIDNRTTGGIYVADTLNHSIRKIDFDNNQVITVVGKGFVGINANDTTPLDQALFNGPRGVAADIGGNLFIADTNNHAIYVADLAKKELKLLAGQPGLPGRADGQGRSAQFNNPSGICISNDGRNIAVCDTGNNSVRLITRDGAVSTVKRASGSNIVGIEEAFWTDQQTDDFDTPLSASFDSLGNLYVVDKSGVKVVTFSGKTPEIISLAQAGTFGQAGGVVVDGTEVIVLDANPTSEQEAVKSVSVGGPQILNLSRESSPLEGGGEIVISGKNFAPESVVVLGDSTINDPRIMSATEIRFTVPGQSAPGKRTLSILTRGGVAQREFTVTSKTFQELANREITTLVGGVSFIGDSGMAVNAVLKFPQGVVVDGAGNLLVADTLNNRIRRIDTSGVITTVAGTGVATFSGDGNQATGAGLNIPRGIALDRIGNLIIADTVNNRIRRVDIKTGTITTIAGNGTAGFSGDGGPAINAALFNPSNVFVDRDNNLFITDSLNNRIRKVDDTGNITTIAGNGTQGFKGDGGPATAASLNIPSDIAIDDKGNLFIADRFNNRVRRVDAATKIITTIAGNGDFRFSGDNGPALQAGMDPRGVAINGEGNLLIADLDNSRIRIIDLPTGRITTVAGTGSRSLTGNDGPAVNAALNLPTCVTVDGAGNLFIADQANNRIRRVDAGTKNISVEAGTDIILGDNNPAINSRLGNPIDLAIDKAGNLFIDDFENNRVRRVDAGTGIITTVAGNGMLGFNGDGILATEAGLASPRGIAVDEAGNLFIADTLNNRIRRVDAATGIITTVAGNGRAGFSGDSGPAAGASLSTPSGVIIDRNKNLFITDSFNNRIRQVNVRGTITTIAGNGTEGFGGDGGPAQNAALFRPFGLALDKANNLFFVDAANNRVRRIDSTTFTITTVAGNGTPGFSGDGGPAISAGLNNPLGIAIDSEGNLFIADEKNHRVRQVDPSGIITTIAGNGVPGFSGDGAPAINASLAFPKDVLLDSAGNLLIAGGFNDAIRIVKRTSGGEPTSGFTLSVNPLSQTITAGSSASFIINVQALGAFNQLIGLSTAVNPPSSNITVTLSANTLTPGLMSTMTVSALAGTLPSSFNITVTGTAGQIIRNQDVTLNVTTAGSPPMIAAIGDQTVRAGEVLDLPVSASNQGDSTGLKLSLLSSPSFVSLTDKGDGTGTVRIAPSPTETQGGSVVIQVTNSAGLSAQARFNVTVLPRLMITSAAFNKPQLSINGIGFGSSGARVMVNGNDISSLITSQTDILILLKGNKKKFSLKKGQNQIIVIAGGVTSNTFVLVF